MKKYRLISLVCSFLVLVFIFSQAQSASITSPGQTAYGYGSTE